MIRKGVRHAVYEMSLFVLLTISLLYFFSSAQQTPSQPQLTLSGDFTQIPLGKADECNWDFTTAFASLPTAVELRLDVNLNGSRFTRTRVSRVGVVLTNLAPVRQ
jgi:hypothetical protein